MRMFPDGGVGPARPGVPPYPGADEADLGHLPFAVAAALLVAAGVSLRLADLLGGRGFWLDELFLLPNVLDRGIGELATPLVNDQIAPLGFLIATKLLGFLPLEAEVSLRIWSFAIEGLGLVALAPVLLRLGMPRIGALTALAAAALLWPFLRHGAEFKHYGSEFAFTLLITCAAMSVLRDPSTGRRLALLAAGAAAAFFTFAAPFALAPAGILLFFRDVRRGDWRAIGLTVGTGAVWAGVFALSLLPILNPETQAEMRGRFWDWAFIPPLSAPFWFAQWVVDAVFGVFSKSAGFREAGGIALLLAGIGTARLLAERRFTLLVLLTGPLAMAFLAAALHLYPFYARFLHFALPGVLALAGWGAAILYARAAPSPVRAVAAVAVAAVLYGPGLVYSYGLSLKPRPVFEHEGMDQVLATIEARWQQGDTLYVGAIGVRQAERYIARENAEFGQIVWGHDALSGPRHFLGEVEALAAGGGRVWIVLGGLWQSYRTDPAVWVAEHLLPAFGARLEGVANVNARAWLYDFSVRPSDRPAPLLTYGDPGTYVPDHAGNEPSGGRP